jgi:site-specific recombinase XerD
MNLTHDHITRGIDGNKWIFTYRAKTEISVKVPLLQQAEMIIEKYKEDPRAINRGHVFPKISNQKMNAYLKEIASLLEIDRKLTFHVARHTFATTVTLSNGVPMETVSKLLGHTKITTTQIYAKVVERKVSKDMEGLRGVLQVENRSIVKISK